MSARKTFLRFSEAQVRGVMVVIVFASLSAAFLLSVLVRLAYLSIRSAFRGGPITSKEWTFFRTQLGYFAACLITANGFSSLAGLLGVSFLLQRGIAQNGFCIAQAFFHQLGNFSSAYFTCALAVHTFASLVFRMRRHTAFYWIVIVVGWVSAAILAAVPLMLTGPSGSIYGLNPSGISCDLRVVYAKHHFFFHLLPIFLAATISAICFAFIFLVIRGTLVFKGGFKFQLNPEARSRMEKGEHHRFMTGLAKNMLWFPAAYVVLLIPYSVTRLVTLGGNIVPLPAMIFAFSCWYTLGIVNVLLLYNIFRLISPAFDGHLGTEETKSNSVAERGLSKANFQQDVVETRKAPFIATLPVAYPDRAVSISSYYDYPNLFKPGNKTVPTSSLGRESFVSPEPQMGLPMPPPRLTPPIVTQPQVARSNPRSPVSLSKGKAVMHDSARVSTGSDLDFSSWLPRRNPDGSMAGRIKNQPMLSAVGPSFPQNQLPRPQF